MAALFRKIFKLRFAILAVGVSAVSALAFITSTGGWVKFAAVYPFLLALLLFAKGKSPLWQALLCAASYYLHGSMLLFIAGFCLLHLICWIRPLGDIRVTLSDLLTFGVTVAAVIGAWFITVRLVGSKQPLFYYYVYDAGLTEAQTKPIQEIATRFYRSHPWPDLVMMPWRSLGKSILPWEVILTWKIQGSWSAILGTLGSAIFALQRFSSLCAVGVVAAPLVVFGALRGLAQKWGGRVALTLYLIPTLMAALIYRKAWAFQFHTMLLYHVLALACLVLALRAIRNWIVYPISCFIASESAISVLWADQRFLAVKGIQHFAFRSTDYLLTAAYVGLVIVIVAATWFMMRSGTAEEGYPERAMREQASLTLVLGRITLGMALAIVVIGIYSLYCLRVS